MPEKTLYSMNEKGNLNEKYNERYSFKDIEGKVIQVFHICQYTLHK